MNTHTEKLMTAIADLESYYGTDIIAVNEVIEFYIRQYQKAENEKRELLNSIDLHKNGYLQTDALIKEFTDYAEVEDERDARTKDSNLFDLMLLKKLITNITIYFVRNEPTHSRKTKY